jgi:NAD(P)H dehydrogenase (quinone)
MTPEIAVTGSTGSIGSSVARQLALAGVPMRLLVRTPERAPRFPTATVHQVSYDDPTAARAALSGVRLAFMVSASESADRRADHRRFVRAAADAGVEHLVYLSFAGASPASTFTLGRDHAATEAYVQELGLGFTFLRDNFYADFMPLLAGADGVIRGPAAEGRVAAVAQRDVGEAASAVLMNAADHLHATYTLTGPEALTMTEIAQILSQAAGRRMSFHNETLDEAYASRASYGAPDWLVDAWVSTYTAIAAGEVAQVTADVEELTGRPAMSLSQLLVDGS